MVQQGGTIIPGHPVGSGDDIIAMKRLYWDRRDIGEAKPVIQACEVSQDRLEPVFGVIDKVHLVDRQHDIPDAEKRRDEGMASCLGKPPFARVDHHDRQRSGGGTDHHIARILIMSRGVGDNEVPLVRGEIAVSDIDGDALLSRSAASPSTRSAKSSPPSWVPNFRLSESKVVS